MTIWMSGLAGVTGWMGRPAFVVVAEPPRGWSSAGPVVSPPVVSPPVVSVLVSRWPVTRS